MADDLANLCRFLFEERPSPSLSLSLSLSSTQSPASVDVLLRRLRSDESIKRGLRQFYFILQDAVTPIGVGDSSGRLGFQGWSDAQVQAVVSIAQAILLLSQSISVDKVERIVLGIIQEIMEFSLCFLEKSGFKCNGLRTEINMETLLEIASFAGSGKQYDLLPAVSADEVTGLCPGVSGDRDDIELYGLVKCTFAGGRCLSEEKPDDRLLITLMSECVQPDTRTQPSVKSPFHQDVGNLNSLSRHLLLVHLGCVKRLLIICKELVQLPAGFEEKMVTSDFHDRLSFCLRILKLLEILSKDVQCVENDVSLLQALALFMDSFPYLVEINSEFTNHTATEGNMEYLVLSVMEGFLNIIQIIFGKSSVFQNSQAYMVACIVKSLDASVWRYDVSSCNVRPPLACFPRTVIYAFRLVQDLKRQTYETQDSNLSCSNTGASVDSAYCQLHQQKIPLLKCFTIEEIMRLIFPSSCFWVDNLFHLVYFLHCEGAKLRPKVERTCSSSLRSNSFAEVESQISHEDEALFGNLFSEGTRSLCSMEPYDQPPVAVSSNLPLQAAKELLSFLKTCIFCPEWLPTIYEEGRKKLDSCHIDILLNIVSCDICCFEDKASDVGCLPQEEVKSGRIAFELLLSLLRSHALSDSLESHLLQQILAVENGNFKYNDRTLALLAHALLSRPGLAGEQLRAKIYDGLFSFLAERAKEICSEGFNLKEFSVSLPSAFHVEILLMAFHLSTEAEKVKHANLSVSYLQKIDVPSGTFDGQRLSSWAMLISRFLVLLRHMISHPNTCPSSLLLDFRSKLREIPGSGANLDVGVGDHLSSWVSLVAKDITSMWPEEESVANLVSQMIDVAPHPPAVQHNAVVTKTLCLSWEVVSATMSRILGLWTGRKARSVEELMVERYTFMLCWDIAFICCPSDSQPPRGDCYNLNISNMEDFIQASHLLLGHFNVAGESFELRNILIRVLHELYAAPEQGLEDLGWDFFRKGSWLSLLLYFLNAGIWGYCKKNSWPERDSFWTECTSVDTQCVAAAEGVISCLIEAGDFEELLRMLASLVSRYLEVYVEAFLATFSTGKYDANSSSFLLLVKHTQLGRRLQAEIEKNGGSSPQIQCIFAMSNLVGVCDRRGAGILCKVFWEFMLQGFPTNLQTSSAILFSCVLSIRGIVLAIDGLLKLNNSRANMGLDPAVLHQILNSVMVIKFDQFFESFHGKCDEIHQNICSALDLPDFTELFLVKLLEGFIRAISLGDTKGSTVLEMVITEIVDIVDSLSKDSSKSKIFKFYLGVDTMLEQISEFYRLQRGDLLVLIDSLDCCYSESVNIKVLNFFVDMLSMELCPDLRKKIAQKFIDMDLVSLSAWLERRLLGSFVEEMDERKTARGNSLPFREAATNFINCLVSSISDPQIRELRNHLFEAMVICLDTAFLSFDIHISKSYFHFVLQLAREDRLMKLLLERTLMLMQKLAVYENLLPGLKFLFGVMGTLLSNRGSPSHAEKSSRKSLASNKSTSMGPLVPRPGGSTKNSEALILSVDQEGGSMSLECDVTSVDEDEDDGTSDGEVTSIDKEDEEDANSERSLASKVCTFTSSGNNFMEQHWYFCYTCDLIVSKGCCSVCAKVCHRGHRVVYSRSSRFFCDCGAGGVRGSSCQCLKPRKFTGLGNAPARGVNNFQTFLPFSDDADQLPESDSDFDEDATTEENDIKLSIPNEIQDRMLLLLEKLDIEVRVLELCTSFLPFITSKTQSCLSKDKQVNLGNNKILSFGADLLQLKKAYKSGSLDLKIKADYANAKDLKSLIANGSLVKSLLSVSVRGRLAVGEGDKVAIFDVGQLIGQATIAPLSAEKANVKPLSRNIVRFEIVHLAFNSVVENYLAVAGLEDCQILTLNPRGEVTDRLAVELALQGAYIRRMDWVPGSQVQLMVVTNKFVKIYDLSQDNISPTHYFTLPNDMIVDATLCAASQGRFFLLVFSDQGNLYRFELSWGGNAGATPLKEIIQIKGKEVNGKGSSLYFSPTYRLLFLSYQDGNSLVCQLSPDATCLTETSCIFEEEADGKRRVAGLHRWKELLAGSGLFVCFSSMKSNTALALSMEGDQVCAQNLRHPSGSSSPLVGITAYKPLSKDKIHCLVLHDDGSLQIYFHVPVGVDADSSMAAEKVKKLGSKILSNKAYAGVKPEFPLDFFEKTACITADVRLGGDALRNGDSEGAKQSLASEDGFIESPSLSGFKISVSNPNPDIVMVGIRVHVGNTSASSIPSEITIFQRSIKLDEGMRSWYDIPFTVAESLLADEEFVVSVGPTFSGTALPKIDSLEVYGRAKDEFGWKEKMDAVLDMEARVLGRGSLFEGSKKKRAPTQSMSVQEQVVAEGLKLLSIFYSLCRPQQELELSDLKCKQLLETVFESGRESLVQAAACHVLQSVFPKKEKYYQVKDTMRLLGVIKMAAILSSRLGICGTGGWIIDEFNAQMRAVSKIALTRKSNFSIFLETNGSEVVDSLMQVLWGILETEPLDTQTMNNIVMSSVELIYSYAECLASHGKDTGIHSVAPAVRLLKKLILFPNEAVQTSSSLAISSRLLQVPFPKQTMLTADDAVETITASVPVRTGVNTQVMNEEDSITSSVQYCCDGCSTVPILRRRWHCTVCPDFDLCEACYEVLDADRLPPPHSRDHPMTAIPIEVESLCADTNEIRFSADEVGVANLLPVITSSSTQASAPSIHVLEPGESGEFSVSLTDPVSISASKRAVNSLILSKLFQEMSGWMETTSGVRAIPVMQLFYRLSSAIGGPFMGSSKPEEINLEKLIKWLLDEINLNKPFAPRSRSSFGEVVIVVFMFFTLMLRNWHQPGSDGTISRASGSTDSHDCRGAQNSTLVISQSPLDAQEREDFTSQLLRACSCVRNQSFVNYLMNILQQLVHVFKSPAANVECPHGSSAGSGCGALLAVRRDLPAGNYSPFFSDSYAKAHRADIFVDYHRLLLENVFRLIYTLVRPEKQEKTGDKEKAYKTAASKDLKLDGFQDVLCSYINNPQTTFVRRYGRRLFLHLCGSKTQYYSVRDSWQFSNEVKKLYKHVEKSGGFGKTVSYERSVKIVRSLSTIAEVAAARPRNWQKYCLRHGDVLPFLLNGAFHFAEESVVQTLKLLSLAFYSGKDASTSHRGEASDVVTGSNRSGSQSLDSKKKKKGEDVNDSGLEKSYMDMEGVVDIFNAKGRDVLRQFVDVFLLEWNASSVRMEAKSVIYGLWHHGRHSFKESLLATLLQKVMYLPTYGQNVVEYTELVTLLLGKAPENNSKQGIKELVDRCLTPDVIRCIFDTLHSQNELIANHPNSRIYSTLSNLVEFDGYYLESEPCVACSSPDVPYSKMKLESLKLETKFTDNRIIVKCTGSYTIQSVAMNVHDARKSKSVKVLNLYYNNRPVSDLAELKNNWSLWKRAKSCHLAFNQSELKVEFHIPITACNFMIELDSFYENLQALSLEPLQCPRCSRPVTDKHGICSNCHENAYQCRQCRNINYENLDSFLCNECGYSKYGRFEFNFMAKPSFVFDNMENDEDMKRGLAAIESESENAHRRYQQLLGFKKPLLKIVSSIGDSEMDSQHKDTVQQMMASLPGPSCKINRKIALLGVLYGEKCKAAFDSVSKSVQTLQGLRRVLMNYLHQKNSDFSSGVSRFVVSRTPNNCYGCATTFVTQCLEILRVLSKHQNCRKQLVVAGILSELFENNIHQGPKTARSQARAALCTFSEGELNAVNELNSLIHKKIMYCLEHHRSMDIALATREEMSLLTEVCSITDEFWESRLRLVFQLLFSSIKLGAKHPAISEHVIFPCLKIISQACTPPKPDTAEKEQSTGKSTSTAQAKVDNGSGITKSSLENSENNWDVSQKTQDIQLVSYLEWEKGASYLDFVRRQYKTSQATRGASQRSKTHRLDYLALKYALRWRRRTSKTSKGGLQAFELGSWVTELVLSACSQSIRSEMCMMITLLCAQSSQRRYRLLTLLMGLLPATLAAGESSGEYFELLFKMVESEDALLFLTVRGFLATICKLITQEVGNIESLERSLQIDIAQGFTLHKLIELLGKFLEVPNIRSRFMRDNLLSQILEALIVIRGLIVQKTKLIVDCNRLLKDLLDSLLLESSENKRQFIRACISGLRTHALEKKGRTCLFILEQLCNLICPSKPEAVYMLILNKAHTQEEFIRGSMTKNPYSSAEIGPLMRDVKNKICQQLDLLGLLEDDYGMELLVAGNIISLDLSIAQVYELVWKKSNTQSSSALTNSALLASNAAAPNRDYPPMTVTYRLQGLDGEATEPMIKELEEDREESQDPEVEFAIAGAVRECGGLEILLDMIKHLQDDFKSNQEEMVAVLNLLMHCCKIRENRRALLRLGALSLLLETARRAFSVDAMEPAEGILLIVESLTLEANESDGISTTQSALTVADEETGTWEQAKKIVLMFLERLSHPSGLKKSGKQQRNTEMVARILPYLTYGEPAAMEALIQHFNPYLQDWAEFDQLQRHHEENPKDESIAQQAVKRKFTVENFVRVSESLKSSSCGERLKDIVLEKGIIAVAVKHLKESFVVAGQAGFKSSMEWLAALKLPSVPHILSMLRGLSMGHLATQTCINEGGILPLLHALEGVSGENEIGARAENLLDTLADKEGKGDGFLGEKVRALRDATKDEMRRRALRKREELLQGLGMRQELSSDGGERIVVAKPILEGLEDVEEEEDGLACMVCREGYKLRPTDLLGVYCYSKRVNLGVSTSGSARGECVYTTVSYFNIIHFQCHQEAKRADAALKTPKKEWEGATLRNNESLCNSLFPVRGPSVLIAQYIRYVDQYWDNLNALGRADGSRLRLLTYDIVLMLARFATGASFSADSRGGGRESNSRFLPFMMQMARHLLDQGSPSQRINMAKTVSAYISSSSSSSSSSTSSDSRPSTPGSQSSSGTEETVQFMMVNSLLSESYELWLQHRRGFLQRGIYHTYMQHAHGRTTSRASASSSSAESTTSNPETLTSDELLSIVRPMLVYTGLIEQLQQFFKVRKPSSVDTNTTDGTVGGGAELEAWEIVMKERLLNVKEMVGFSKELISWLDDMNSASDLQEAFDVVGVLADVLSSGVTQCDEFVRSAINAGKG